MAFTSRLLKDQIYTGGYAPVQPKSVIIVLYIDDTTPYMSFYANEGAGMDGGGKGMKPNNVTIYIDRNPNAPYDYATMTVTLPDNRRWETRTYPNNVANNKTYARFERANFVVGTQEYVPDIRNGYVDIIKALYKDQSVEGLSAENITPEVVAIVDTMLDEIQDGSKAMVGVDIVFQLFYGITNWSGFIRNAKGVDYSDTVDWLNVLRGNSNYTTIVNYTAAQYKNPLQIALLTAKK